MQLYCLLHVNPLLTCIYFSASWSVYCKCNKTCSPCFGFYFWPDHKEPYLDAFGTKWITSQLLDYRLLLPLRNYFMWTILTMLSCIYKLYTFVLPLFWKHSGIFILFSAHGTFCRPFVCSIVYLVGNIFHEKGDCCFIGVLFIWFFFPFCFYLLRRGIPRSSQISTVVTGCSQSGTISPILLQAFRSIWMSPPWKGISNIKDGVSLRGQTVLPLCAFIDFTAYTHLELGMGSQRMVLFWELPSVLLFLLLAKHKTIRFTVTLLYPTLHSMASYHAEN